MIGLWIFLKSVWSFLYRLTMPVLLALLIVVSIWGAYAFKLAGVAHARKQAERQVIKLRAEIEDPRDGWRVKLTRCEASVDELTGSLETQNAAVDQLKADADERTRRANAAIQAARQQASGLKARIARLEQAKPSGDMCVAARDLIVSTLSEDRQ